MIGPMVNPAYRSQVDRIIFKARNVLFFSLSVLAGNLQSKLRHLRDNDHNMTQLYWSFISQYWSILSPESPICWIVGFKNIVLLHELKVAPSLSA